MEITIRIKDVLLLSCKSNNTDSNIRIVLLLWTLFFLFMFVLSRSITIPRMLRKIHTFWQPFIYHKSPPLVNLFLLLQILFVHRPFGYLTPTKLVLLLLQHKVKKQGYYKFSECSVGILVFNGFSAFIAKLLVYIFRAF